MERRADYRGPVPPPLEDVEAHFVPMSRRRYRAFSHLDRRMAPSIRGNHRLTLRHLLERRDEIESSSRPVTYVFHTAFCGSTLLADSLDQDRVCLSYKEPLSLSQMCLAKPCSERPPAVTEIEWRELSRATVALLSKVFQSSETALIKPSNACNNSIPELLSATGEPARAILLYSNLTDFLCSILKSDARRHWARQGLEWTTPASPSHDLLATIDRRRLPDGPAAAYLWLWQIYAFLDACESPYRSSVRSLDCERFFSRPEETLSTASEFLRLPLTTARIRAITSGAGFRTYSKAGRGATPMAALLGRLQVAARLGEAFDAAKRRSILDRTAAEHRDEIKSALAWVRDVTRDRPVEGALPNPLGNGDAAF
jgi:hypothetical protein